ncbi:hypothetical protein CASFOL_015826 [Castilleja foliolosa]|uniref:F-box domain-containing protein n=1 Tax=Castilleja foliolosa TaxID=1961234 RepID=A0ABD3DEU6_9LAMI
MQMGGEFELPEPMIEHIQYFLTGKEAAQTTVLSKSWRSAWLTRPILVFNEDDFERYSNHDDGLSFSEFAKKITQRYEESNLRIERIVIHIKNGTSFWIDLASDLIVRALKIGATHINCEYHTFVLPHEVLEAENLVELSLVGVRIDINSIKCVSLKSLSLVEVRIDPDTIYSIIYTCPLIQKLELSCIRETQSATGPSAPCPTVTDLPRLCELRCLVLCNLEFDTFWYFGDLFPELPSLQDLTLKNCKNVREVCSPSLERVTFESDHRSRVEFDVPSIKKFTLEGSVIPWVFFKSTSSKYWESRVSITCEHDHRARLSTSWFIELNQLLTELSQSKIYLSLHIRSKYSFDYEVDDFEGLTRPQVENVTVDIIYLPSLSCYALFDGLFRLCCPSFITQYLLPESSIGAKRNDFVSKILVQGMKRTCSFQSCFMYGLLDIEEVNLEIYDEDVPAWIPLPLKSLLDASKSLTKEQKIRFQLKWNL